MNELTPVLRALAGTSHLLVACDYDGTLAPIVEDPSAAPPLSEAISALRVLASLHNTSVAVISGRSLRDLALMSRLPSEVHLVGSHGSEFDPGFAETVEPERLAVLDQVAAQLTQVVASCPGARLEHKPVSVALHIRGVDRELARIAVDRAVQVAQGLPDVHVRHGKEVLELSVLRTDKGDALNRIRHTVGATAVLFVGDDVTDEDAFATLSGPDVGVKVGPEPTCATVGIADPRAAAQMLAELGELRHQWLFGASVTAIERHSMLSDQRTAALVTGDGNVSWLCHPRLDAAAVFAELLGGPGAGRFAISPASGTAVLSHRYLGGSMIAETRWPDLTLVDYLDCSGGRMASTSERTDLIRVLSGTGEALIHFAPRPDFGRNPTQLRINGDAVEVMGSAVQMVLLAPGVSWTIETDGHHHSARGRLPLDGREHVLELRLGTRDLAPDPHGEPDRRRLTDEHWRDWSDRLKVPQVAPELVRRAALTIKGLCFAPSGALAAAATTSLPEELGGVRNWDYRYCWIRDAALATGALVRLGSYGEARAYLDWVHRLIERIDSPEQLHPVYTLDGGQLGPEAVIAELSGYAGSRPVRVGNAADHQVQLDVFGPVAVLIDQLDQRGATLGAGELALLDRVVEAVLRRWHEPDHGIWEERVSAQHHVHSKVMCWLTLDRAIAVFARRKREGLSALEAARDRIRDEVLERGWNPRLNAFTNAYGSEYLDASVLHIGLSGMLAATDPRFVSTVHAIETSLRNGPVVWRYVHDDGLPGREGGFLLCALWLAEAYVRCGRLADGVELFEQVCDLAGPTGLMSEQYDPHFERALGNFPQTYSHHGVIDTALTLAAALGTEPSERDGLWARVRTRAARRHRVR